MINSILRLAIERRVLVLCSLFIIVGIGIWSYQKLPIDAVPEEDELNSIEISPEGLPPDDPLSTAHAGTPTRFVKNEPYIPPDIGYDRDYMASDTVDL